MRARLRERIDVAAIGCALVVAVVALVPLLAGLRFFGLDHSRILLPMTCALHRAVGQVVARPDGPVTSALLLDDSFAGGGPLLQDPEGLVWSPVAWALLPASPETAASLFVVVMLAIAAFAGVRLGRSFGLSTSACVALGLAHAACGTTLNLVQHGVHLSGAAFLPLVWAGAREVRHGVRVRDDVGGGVGAGIVSVVVGLGGLGLHGALQVALWGGLIGLWHVVSGLRGRRVRSDVARLVGGLGGALAAGSLIAGLQIVPLLDLRTAAARAAGVTDLSTWALSLPEAFGVLWPHVAQARTDVDATLVQAWHGSRMARAAWNTDPFVGMGVFVALAATVVVLRGGLRRLREPLALAWLAGVMALGDATPMYRVVLALCPPLALFRYPAKYLQLSSLALFVVVAALFDAAARSPALRRVVVRALVVASCISIAALVVVIVRSDAIAGAAAAVAGRAPLPDVPRLPTVLAVAMATSALWAAGLAALCASRWRRAVTTAWVLELLVAAPAAVPVATPWLNDARPPPPSLAMPSSSPAWDKPVLCAGKKLGALHVDDARGDLGLEGDLLPDVVDHKTNFQQCRGPAKPHDFLSTSQRASVLLSRTILDEEHGVIGPAIALGCTHLSTRASLPPSFVVVPQPERPAFAAPIVALPNVLPPSAVLDNPTLIAHEDELLQRIARATTAADVLTLVDDPAHTLAGMPLPSPASSTTSPVAVRAVQFDDVAHGTIDVHGSGPAVVMVKKPWWPGWQASQAGRTLPVVRVAGVQLGVVVTDAAAGPIALAYRAPLVPVAVGLAALGVAWAVGLVVVTAKARRRAR